MTDTSRLNSEAAAISSSSAKIRAFAVDAAANLVGQGDSIKNLIVANALAMKSEDALRARVDALEKQVAALTAAPSGVSFGISTGAGPNTPATLTGSALTNYMAKLAGTGCTKVRVDCYGVGTQFDAEVAAAAAAGLHTLCVVQNPDAAGAIAAHYLAQGVVEYETGNEPNLHGITPSAWRDQNNQVYDAIKAESKSTKVISAGLANWGKYGDGLKNPLNYLQGALTGGDLKYDVFGFHPYYYNLGYSAAQMLSLSDPYSGVAAIVSFSTSIIGILSAAGLPQRIAATEFGAPTNLVTPQTQADLIAQMVPWWTTQPWADDLYVYSLQDRADLSGNEAFFGIYTTAWAAKPAVAALQAAVR